MTAAKFELPFTRGRKNVKTTGNLTVKNSLQGFDAKEMYLQPKNRSVLLANKTDRFLERQGCFVFITFEHSPNAVSKMCRLEFRFHNLPFSKSAGTKCAVFM